MTQHISTRAARLRPNGGSKLLVAGFKKLLANMQRLLSFGLACYYLGSCAFATETNADTSRCYLAWKQRQEIAIQEMAFCYLFKTQSHKWPRVKHVLVSANSQFILHRLERDRYPVMLKEPGWEAERLYFDAELPTWEDQSHALILVRVQHLGAYDKIHQERGENFWEWATLRLSRRNASWQITGLKGRWDHE